MDRSSESEFRSAFAPASASATTSASSSHSAEYPSARSETTSTPAMEERGPCGELRASVDEQIQLSKSHWSELAASSSTSTGDEVAADNLAAFGELLRHPTWCHHPSWDHFFKTFGYDSKKPFVYSGDVYDPDVWKSSGTMEVGEKFAEGGQSELFHVKITWANKYGEEFYARIGKEWVLKVFKKGIKLRDFKKYWDWPHLYLIWWAQDTERYNRLHKSYSMLWRWSFSPSYGTLLSDGRFAFLMERQHMDLRSFIDSCKLEYGYEHGPFQEEDADWYMYGIALGMYWLHRNREVHRDLKASNVLVHKEHEKYGCYIADYECTAGVVGTGFWRAPEILQAIKEKNINQRPKLFSVEVDAYSYAMTWYEVLTGKIPFEDHPLKEDIGSLMDLVIKHEVRPEVPIYANVWTRVYFGSVGSPILQRDLYLKRY